MDKKLLEEFKLDFINTLNELQTTTYSEMDTTSKGDNVDISVNERENLLKLKLNGRNKFLEEKIIESLAKIEDGTFGTCDDCGEDIALARLKARPMATRCIDCKEAEERDEKHIPYEKKSHTRGVELINDNASIPSVEVIKGTGDYVLNQNKEKLGLKSVIPA